MSEQFKTWHGMHVLVTGLSITNAMKAMLFNTTLSPRVAHAYESFSHFFFDTVWPAYDDYANTVPSYGQLKTYCDILILDL